MPVWGGRPDELGQRGCGGAQGSALALLGLELAPAGSQWDVPAPQSSAGARRSLAWVQCEIQASLMHSCIKCARQQALLELRVLGVSKFFPVSSLRSLHEVQRPSPTAHGLPGLAGFTSPRPAHRTWVGVLFLTGCLKGCLYTNFHTKLFDMAVMMLGTPIPHCLQYREQQHRPQKRPAYLCCCHGSQRLPWRWRFPAPEVLQE